MTGSKRLVLLFISLWLALVLVGCSESSKMNQPGTNTHAKSSISQQMTGAQDRNGADKAETIAGKVPVPEDKPETKNEKQSADTPAKASALEKTTSVTGPPDKAEGNAEEKGETQTGVRLVVTRDFGQSLVFDRWVPISESTSALTVTTGNLETQTAYGGVFITSINGIASGYTGKAVWNKEKVDWFLYYNGKTAGTGADQITVKAGDVIWWDYHDWSGEQRPLPAVPPT